MSDRLIPNYSYEILADIVPTLRKDLNATPQTCRTAKPIDSNGLCDKCPFKIKNTCATTYKDFKTQVEYHFPELFI